MTILGIESSCDETSAAIVVDDFVRSNVISSQLIHQKYGGVVPELASRAHLQMIIPVIEEAFSRAHISKNDVEGVAVSFSPGLMGSLLVGVNFAKALSLGLKIPLIGVNHIDGHIYSTFFTSPVPEFPFLSLIVSGGHTRLILIRASFEHEIIGETLDDAAGEAFDKVAKMLNIGYPGGPIIDKLAKKGNPNAIHFPRSMKNSETFDFSFSGLKTAVLYYLRDNSLLPSDESSKIDDEILADICASFQEAVVDILTSKTITAAKKFGVGGISIAGGVSANSGLREKMKQLCEENKFSLHIPKFEYCTDNAAMIALVGAMKFKLNIVSDYTLVPVPNGY
ncbi:MAG: tRNA (adenosine(37)-N6)-threonylcarbamoyltransferase complex transferase subunit TsaD [Bacteroidota bacterium]